MDKTELFGKVKATGHVGVVHADFIFRDKYHDLVILIYDNE